MKRTEKGQETVAIYVHWPFCQSKCPYCDFNSHVRESIDEGRFLEAYLSELDHFHGGESQAMVSSVFFGGGTPSLMSGRTVRRILDHIADLWGCAPEMEVTLEANPGSSDRACFEDFREAGVNRLSIGVQALDDERLSWLGRAHSADEAKAAAKEGRRIFNNLSLDLIYATENQGPADWRSELSEATDFGSDHLSLYQLTIEPGTLFYQLSKRGRLREVGETLGRALYEATQDVCDRAGLPAYEISNHARRRFECLHNLNYWRGGAYIGIGPGAHGRIEREGKWFATEQLRSPEAWLARALEKGEGSKSVVELSSRERLEETLMMGLRLSEGVNLSAKTGTRHEDLTDVIDFEAMQNLQETGFLQREGTRVAASSEGKLVLNRIISELILA